MLVSSYHGGTSSSGVINIIKDIDQDIAGRHILLSKILLIREKHWKVFVNYLEKKAASVKLLHFWTSPKDEKLILARLHMFLQFQNEFVVGYGLDFDENYRNLPYVDVLKEEVYTK